MQDRRRVVEDAAEAVAAEIPDDGTPLAFHEGLDGRADIVGRPARPDRGDAAHHGLVCNFAQALGPARDLAHIIHPARIPVPPVDDQGHVDVDDIALAQRLLVRNAVADDVIDRGAGGFRVAAIMQGRREGAMVHGELEDQLVQLVGGHAGADVVRQHIQRFRREAASAAHALERLRPMHRGFGCALAFEEGDLVFDHGTVLVEARM